MQEEPFKTLTLETNLNLFIKAVALDFSEAEIKKLLDFDQESYELMLSELSSLFKTNSHYYIISHLLQNNTIDRYDLTREPIKKIALNYSDFILISLPDRLNNLHLSDLQNKIEGILNDFISEIKTNFKKLYAPINLSEDEILYCKLFFYEFDKIKDYTQVGNTVISHNFDIIESLQRKTQTNNFFNSIRKINEIELCSDIFKPKHCQIFKEKLVNNTFLKLNGTLNSSDFSIKEKKLRTYFTLINHYNEIEDHFLFPYLQKTVYI